MDNRELFRNKSTMIMLDRAYAVRFTMRAVFLLEEAFGTAHDAFKGLSGESAQALGVLARVLSVLTGQSPEAVEAHLSPEAAIRATEAIYEAAQRDFPPRKDGAGDEQSGTNDWLELYCAGRYRLLMSEDEFWDCTVKRFVKMYEKWYDFFMEERGLSKPSSEPEIYEGPLRH